MTAASPYELLTPRDWRGLLARAAFYHATRAQLTRLVDEPGTMPTVSQLLATLEIAAGRTSRHDDDADAVAFVIDALAECIRHNVDHPDLNDDERAFLIRLQSLVSDACGEDPLRRIFDALQAQASALYGHRWRPARLSVTAAPQHPRMADTTVDPYALTAFTQFPPSDDENEVELRIWLSKFGPAAFAAVPMLLAHEFICHVPAVQDKAKPDSDFAEGFLDWAAYYFCVKWAVRIDSDMAAATRDHASRLRGVLARRPRAPEVTARELGHAAAAQLVVWFEQRHDMELHESEVMVAKLAIDLNVVDRPLDVKDRFVSYLSSTVPPQVEAGLDDWLAGQLDAADLLDIEVVPA